MREYKWRMYENVQGSLPEVFSAPYQITSFLSSAVAFFADCGSCGSFGALRIRLRQAVPPMIRFLTMDKCRAVH